MSLDNEVAVLFLQRCTGLLGVLTASVQKCTSEVTMLWRLLLSYVSVIGGIVLLVAPPHPLLGIVGLVLTAVVPVIILYW